MSSPEMLQLRETIEALKREIQKNTERISELEKHTGTEKKNEKMPASVTVGDISMFCVVHKTKKSWESFDQVVPCPEDNAVIFKSKANDKTVKLERYHFERVFDGFPALIHHFQSAPQLIDSCLDGFNVFVFFYGALEWISNRILLKPFIDLTAGRIFHSNGGASSGGNWKYCVKVSNWYTNNDNIVDVLVDDIDKNWKDCTITTTLDGKGVYVSNLTQVEIRSTNDVEKIYRLAEANQHQLMAKCHPKNCMCSVFQFHVHGYNTRTAEKSQGSVFIVQLPTTESGNNKQLPDWKRFIGQLATRNFGSINKFRKLMSFIEGNYENPSKTLACATFFPEKNRFDDTLNTLKFASKLSTTTTYEDQ